VVIAIIGLLSTVAVVALNSARVSSRVARRNADIQQIFKAFSLAYDVGGAAYPASGGCCLSVSCGGGWAGVAASATVDAYLSPYLARKPIDPADGVRTVTGYVYTSPWTGTSAYDGYVFPSASYLSWFTETTSNLNGICNAGRIYSSTAVQTQCFLQLN